MTTQNNEINAPLPISLLQGGTAAALTASAGGIFYSTSSAGAILSGTATANCILLSGATAPIWSTATYPATTNVSELLYSSATNVISGLTTANSACLVSNSSNAPIWSGSMSDGQLIIGSTGSTPVAANLIAGTNVTITNAPGAITINASSGGTGNWVRIASRTASNSATLDFTSQLSSTYIAYQLVLVNLLPATAGAQLWLRWGDSGGILLGDYLNQICDIANNGSSLSYPGDHGTGAVSQAALTYANNNGISASSTYGGVCGNVDLFITSGASHDSTAVSHTSYMSNTLTVNYCNTTSSFIDSASANLVSIQLLMSSGNIISGTAYLYGLT